MGWGRENGMRFGVGRVLFFLCCFWGFGIWFRNGLALDVEKEKRNCLGEEE